LQIDTSGIQYKSLAAKEIIFCEGYQGAANPFFSWLPFSLNKGEILDIETDLLANEYIYNKAVYVLGLGEKRWRIGATYNWRQVDAVISPDGRQELEIKLKNLLKLPFTVIDQKAGIRPAVRDRRPLIGRHPRHPNVNLFNGMGSKGVMMAPYLAHHFERVLSRQEELNPEVNILRYLALYQEHK
jgi:glycine/D-amino acid oxidase-like deaminating enzyme